MQEQWIRGFALLGFCLALDSMCTLAAVAQSKSLNAVFTTAPIKVDGYAESAWNKAPAANIAICMNAELTVQLSDCKVSGTVQALWNGPLLYLLISVTDPEVSTSASEDSKRSGVEIYVDQYDDKFPKFEEDDGFIIIGADGRQTGNRTNAGLMYYPAVWSSHLKSYAAAPRLDANGNKIGYTVEVSWAIGDLPLKNGTELGMEFAINALSSDAGHAHDQLYWRSGNNKGINDNTMWGDVVLTGYDSSLPMPLNMFVLEENIRKASPSSSSAAGLVRGIWTDESRVDRALAAAKNALDRAKTQAEIDAADLSLDAALRGLHRSGKYPDPYDLPAVNYLPDPFTFLNGKRVHSAADWQKRRAEIKDLAQYYEFGTVPAPPQSLTAESAPGPAGALQYKTITVTVKDHGTTAFFKPILYLPTTGQLPYPVIVEEDFAASPKFSPPEQGVSPGRLCGSQHSHVG
jgi:hypothetical protein